MSKPMKGKIAVVTGGANGIGFATVQRLAREGADIAILDREEGPLQEAAAFVKKEGGRALPMAVDMLKPPAVAEAFAKIKKELGPVDILVNNVGQSARGASVELQDSSDDLVEFILAINLKSAMLCSRLVVPDMRARKSGKIVCLSSEAGFNGTAKMSEYAASKAGIIGFIRVLATELAPFNVNVNAICPGLTRTRAFDQLPADMRSEVLAGIPWGRAAEPEEMANVIHFLCSEQSSYVSGHAIVVNGANCFN